MSAPTVTRLVEADWRVFATLRLRALTDTLGTGDRQYLEELAFTAAQLRRRLRAHAQFALLYGDELVGLIGAQRQSPDVVYLYSLWLEPGVRGRGLGRELVMAAVDWAATSLGAPDTWTPALRQSLDLLLATKFGVTSSLPPLTNELPALNVISR